MESDKLESIQPWFGRAISRPLILGDGVARVSEERELRLAAEARIRSTHGVDGFERLAIYNRQYWFRLVSCMQETYPCAVHVLGLQKFNDWVMRFLQAHPSDTPYLAELDARFAEFMGKNYSGENSEAVFEAIACDRAFDRAFTAPDGRLPVVESQGKISISPHATPLWLHWDFSSYRAMCKDDEELKGVFPLVAREYGVLIYRHDHRVYEKEIPRSAFLILDSLRTPKTLDEIFSGLDTELTPEMARELEKNLSLWFRDWVELGWIAGLE